MQCSGAQKGKEVKRFDRSKDTDTLWMLSHAKPLLQRRLRCCSSSKSLKRSSSGKQSDKNRDQQLWGSRSAAGHGDATAAATAGVAAATAAATAAVLLLLPLLRLLCTCSLAPAWPALLPLNELFEVLQAANRQNCLECLYTSASVAANRPK